MVILDLAEMIGDGEDVRVWGDKWISVPTTFSIQTPVHTLQADAKVKDLIDTDTKAWKTALVKELFWEDEAQAILNIPLSPLQANDRRIWRGTKNAEYSVRSTYHMEMELSRMSNSSCSDHNKDTKLWQNVWKSNVPNVVKMFMWMALNDLLPTKANLFRRGVVKESLCPICGAEEDTVYHAIWD
jgi:hypothetical protein